MKQYLPLNRYLTEYNEKNNENKYRPVAVGRYGIQTRESIYSKELANDYSKNKLIYRNTLTVGMGSVQIDIGILTEDKVYSVSPAYHTYKIREINANYLRYCLECRNHDMFVRYVKRGTRQGKSIDLKRWLSYCIPVYDMENQLEIVEKLDKLSYLIEQRKKQLELLKILVKSHFIEMFGDPCLNTRNFNEVPLKQLYDVSSSKRIYQEEQTLEGIPFYKISDLVDKIRTGSCTPQVYITNSTYQDLKEKHLTPTEGDILITSRGTLGLCYEIMADDEFYFQDGMISWLYNKREIISNTYLCYIFQMDGIKRQIDGVTSGSTVRYLSIDKLKNLKVILPPIELQNEFADFVTSTNKSKTAIQKSLDDLETLKKSLMQQYFA